MLFEPARRASVCGLIGALFCLQGCEEATGGTRLVSTPTCHQGPWGNAVEGKFCNERWSVDRGHSLSTGALRHHVVATCKAQCEADASCTMITVDDHENICVLCQGPLKTLGDNGVAWLNSYVPSRWGNAVVGEYCDEQYSVDRARSMATSALKHHDVATCKAQCLNDPSCSMITVDDHEDICVLCQGPLKRLRANGAAWLNSYVPC